MLTKSLKQHSLTTALTTFFNEIKVILNSRLLSFVIDDPNGLKVSTPNHVIIEKEVLLLATRDDKLDNRKR